MSTYFPPNPNHDLSAKLGAIRGLPLIEAYLAKVAAFQQYLRETGRA